MTGIFYVVFLQMSYSVKFLMRAAVWEVKQTLSVLGCCCRVLSSSDGMVFGKRGAVLHPAEMEPGRR